MSHDNHSIFCFDKFSKEFMGGREQWPITIWTFAHFILGMIAWLIGLHVWLWFVLASGWEVLEVSSIGLFYLNKLGNFFVQITGIKWWDDYNKDSISNSVCDILFGVLGWWVAEWTHLYWF